MYVLLYWLAGIAFPFIYSLISGERADYRRGQVLGYFFLLVWLWPLILMVLVYGYIKDKLFAPASAYLRKGIYVPGVSIKRGEK